MGSKGRLGTHRSHGGRRRHGTPRNGSRRERDLKKKAMSDTGRSGEIRRQSAQTRRARRSGNAPEVSSTSGTTGLVVLLVCNECDIAPRGRLRRGPWGEKSRPLRSGMVFKGQSRDGAKPGRAGNGPGTVPWSKFRRVRPPEGLATEPVPVSRRSDSDVSFPIRRRERRTRATPP